MGAFFRAGLSHHKVKEMLRQIELKGKRYFLNTAKNAGSCVTCAHLGRVSIVQSKLAPGEL